VSAAAALRPPIDTIPAPPLPIAAAWVNSPALTMEALRGRPVLIDFWDFCRPNSLRALPYIKAWHERYAAAGLTLVSVHCPGFRASANEDAIRTAVAALEIVHPVLLDTDFELWQEYENAGWPARYLWNAEGLLADYHYGEGDYAQTELAIQALLGIEREPLAPLRPEDAPGARLVVPSEERRAEPWSGPYEAGGVWAVLEPRAGRERGTVAVNGRELAVERAGAALLIAHEHHQRGDLALDLGADVRCDAVCFTAGLATP
jgi:thiol-disulfide isomerase/thioredoxin